MAMSKKFEHPRYRRPPITEAVLELRLAQPLEQSIVEKCANRLESSYFSRESENQIEVKLDATEKRASSQVRFLGFKLATLDRSDFVAVRVNTLFWSRTAPYTGWEVFSQRIARDLQIIQKFLPVFPKLSRVGLRYINRIDIQNSGATLQPKDYLNIIPLVPDLGMEPMDHYVLQVTQPIGVLDLNVTINSGTVESPLIEHTSMLLDLDISSESNLPCKYEDLFDMLTTMRLQKNIVFEACVTDKAREIFNR